MTALTLSEEPLISCLCVTGDRPVFLARAITDFLAQTWTRRELVIVVDGDAGKRAEVAAQVAALGHPDVRVVFAEPNSTLGALRNVAIEAARGELLAQWDDDDLNAPNRLSTQASRLLEQDADACLLSSQLQWFVREGAVFFCDWARADDPVARLIPGTVMVRRESSVRYPETGPSARTGEDSAYLRRLAAAHRVVGLADSPHVYVYTSHGMNTWSTLHHLRLASLNARDLPDACAAAVATTLERFGIEARVASPDLARELYRRALADAPDTAEVLRHRARVALDQDDPQGAVTLLLRAVDLDPDDGTAWGTLGKLALLRADAVAARKALLRAVELRPDNPAHHRDLAFAWGQLGQPQRAARLLEDAVASLPGEPDLHAELAAAQLAMGRGEAARASLNAALALDPGHRRAVDLAARTKPR